jgi:DeoR family transcriptional regulator, suf operon transcriptional repressor
MLGEPSTGGALEFFSSTRQMLLVAIKNMGEATTEQLARETYLSPGAVRAHLLALEAQGLVSFDRLRDGPGRPRHVFRLTRNGERLFPQRYAEIANTVFSAVEAEDDAVVERVFQRLIDDQVDLARQSITAASRPERLLELVTFIERYGFFPRLESLDNGPAALTLRHCPLLSVASAHPGVCEAECKALERVMPGAKVTRTAWRLERDPVCTYTIE